jgi:protein-S-isoprenylcysteine O-methyltransferase Ste14
MPKFQKGFQEIIGIFNFFLFQGVVIIVIFIPLKMNLVTFITGGILFTISFFCYILSLVNYATSNPDKPVTKGIYRLSRNPQQIFTIFMWIGIGLLTGCILIILISIIQFITVYPTFKAQESFCLEKYGNDYSEYMDRTPRYFLFI